jgi:hypothetical protein
MIDILLHHFREVWIFFALGMGGFLVARPIRARKRTKALTTVAQEIGFTVRGDDWLKVGNRNQQPEANQMGTALFLDGTDRRFNNIMTGTAVGCKASLFDYSYSPLKGRIAQTVAAYSQERCLPFFQLRPKNSLDRAADALFHQDIDFNSHPEFSRRYVLWGPPANRRGGAEEDNVRALFSPALLTFLQELPRNDKWHIEGSDSTLVLYRQGAILRADKYRSFLDETSSIARTFFNLCG